MAPGVASASPRHRTPDKAVVVAPGGEEIPGEVEMMKRKNRELEAELRRSREREGAARRELEVALERLRVAEEAEERLCAQLGELEAETLGQARGYLLQIRSLMEQLSRVGQQAAPVAVAP